MKILITAIIFVASAALVAGQAAPPPKPPMAEEVFKNIQVLKGVPADEFLGSMGFIANALAVNCTYCHVGEGGGGWDEYAKDTDKKEMARKMMVMMSAINKTYFGGTRRVTCVSCHNGSNRPKTTTNMAVYYRATQTDEPDDILRQAPGAPSTDQVIDKYLAAVGGAQRLAAVTSIVAKGTYLAYGDAQKSPFEVYVKAPGQRTEIIHTLSGDTTTAFDGRLGWTAMPEAFSPLPTRALAGTELEGVKFDAALSFPGQLKQALKNWRGAIPATMGDHDVQVIEGLTESGLPVKLYFDDESGLLLRQVRYTETPIGRNSWQIDYDDYRSVGNSGTKMPFKWRVLWQSGDSRVELTDVQPNVAVDAARFTRPAAPPRPRTP
jgi:photosynthetic reaction center cytochrome c subunit